MKKITTIFLSAIAVGLMLPWTVRADIALPSYYVQGTITEAPQPVVIVLSKNSIAAKVISGAVVQLIKRTAWYFPPIIPVQMQKSAYAMCGDSLMGTTTLSVQGQYGFFPGYAQWDSGSYALNISAPGFMLKDTSFVFNSQNRYVTLNAALTPVSSWCTISGTVTSDYCYNCITCRCSAPAPLPGCTVSVSRAQIVMCPILLMKKASGTYPNDIYKAVTDANGQYKIDSVPLIGQDYVMIAASKNGFSDSITSGSLNVNGALTANFQLNATTPVIRPVQNAGNRGFDMAFSSERSTLVVSATHASNITVRAILPSGRAETGALFSGRILSGSNEISLARMMPGLHILSIAIDGAIQAMPISVR
jgi:hypothetical protein